ncbi:MAG: ABC transporter permease [Actinobacteria bacterium]|nr:ABC transporter permease [Actinomycetota bacterium]
MTSQAASVRRSSPATDVALRILARYGVLIAFAIMILVFAIVAKNFWTIDTLKNILRDSSPGIVVAVGLTVVLVMQDFDLSISGMIGLATGCAVALMVYHGWGWGWAIVIALLFGVGAGLVNGFLIAILRGNSFIMTLAMATILTGIELAFTNNSVVFTGVPQGYVDIAARDSLGLSNQFWIALGIAVFLWLLLDTTESGRFMYAIGGNPEAARLSGIQTRKLRVVGFVIVGITAAIVGILISSFSAAYNPQRGAAYLLPAYAGAFLGSACFRPGTFNVPGTVAGVLFLGTIQTGLTYLNLQTYLIGIVQGAILIGAVLLSTLAARRG